MRQRVLRGYRHAGPGRFYIINQGIRKAISGGKIPVSVWAANPDLPALYLVTSEKHDEVFHEAKHGSDLAIMQRDMLQQQLCDLLDEMAAMLEGAAVRAPELLLNSGFDLAKERRSTSRAKPAATAPVHEVSAGEHQGSNQ